MLNKKNIKEIIGHFGETMQLQKTVEEFAELSVELIKHSHGKDRRKQIVEEMADVIIMLEQVVRILNIKDEEIEEVMNMKIQRTLDYIDEELGKKM